MEFKLIVKKLNKSLSPKEEIIFEKWYNESKDHKKYFDNVKKHFHDDPLNIDVKKGWELIENKIQRPKNNRYYWKYAAVASIVLILGITVFYNFLRPSSKQIEFVKTDLKAGTDKAILTLEDGLSITLEKGKPFHLKNLSSNGETIVYKTDNSLKKDIIYNYLTIPRGGQFLLTLTDGTRIWLNSDSKIKYPKEFNEGDLRKVELVYGEAYFEVSPSSKHKGGKFRVITKDQMVEVLGTEFNIKAYNDEDSIYTTLVKGSVEIDKGNYKEFLKPNQQSIISSGKDEITVIPVDTYDITSWRKGVFSFRNTSLYEITKVLSRWYDTNFIFENEDLKSIKYNGVLDKNHSIETILSILKTTNNIDYEIKDRTIILK
jgi:ferric-dicitrate binding protein FerR (iron transport regulator)